MKTDDDLAVIVGFEFRPKQTKSRKAMKTVLPGWGVLPLESGPKQTKSRKAMKTR